MKVKWIIVAVVVLLLIAMQFLFGGKDGKTSAPDGQTRTAAIANKPESIDENVAGTAAGTVDETVAPEPAAAEPAAPEKAERPEPTSVTEIAVGAGEGALRLERADDGWDVVGATSAPADSAKVEKLLSHLLEAPLLPRPESAGAVTGLEDSGGMPVRLTTADCGDYELHVGLRPEGAFDRTYVRLPDGEVGILGADVRGELGLWKNVPDVSPSPAAWVQKTVLSFDPGEAVRIEAAYPDHRIVFERSPEGEWEQRGYVPGGVWDRGALKSWLEDLSRFQVSGVGGAGGVVAGDSQKLHEIAVTLADGRVKSVRVAAGHGDGAMPAETSDYPGHVFNLPEWRFDKYFHRHSSLFPGAAPRFEPGDVRFLDIRHAGETVKFTNRGDGWRSATSPYPARGGELDRLVRMLSSWRPEDYANPDFKSIRPVFAGPMVEVILAGGDVHQYRLAGRHPLFPWRYVILDNASIFSVTDVEAGVMFPRFTDVMDLGGVLPMAGVGDVREVVLEEGDGGVLLALRRNGDGVWEAGDGVVVGDGEAGVVVEGMLSWAVAGFYNYESRGSRPEVMYQLRVADGDGVERIVQFLEPEERDIPYILDGGRAFLLDRKSFFNWLGSVRELAGRVEAVEAECEAAGDGMKSEGQLAAEEATADAGVSEVVPEVVPDGAGVRLSVEEVASGEESREEVVEDESVEEGVGDPHGGDEVPVDIPVGEPSLEMDGDLIDSAIGEVGGEPVDAGELERAEVERFVDGYVGPALEYPDVGE